MRTFYIFNICKEFINLNRTNPYKLFRTFEEIFNAKVSNNDSKIYTFERIVNKINKDNLSQKIFDKYKGDDHYTKFMNTHLYNNYYSDESSKLIINNAFMRLDTTVINPEFFKILDNNKSLFVCDFKNKDYFWLHLLHKK